MLIPGFYRCHNCGRDVERVHRVRRWWLCDECQAAIVEPTRPGESARLSPGDELWRAREAYWQWVEGMERRYPSRVSHGLRPAPPAPALSSDSYYPYCECGAERRVMSIGRPGLFGGPFAPLCPDCEARHTVEHLYRAAPRLAPGRDEEEWLDLLLKSHPELFEMGLLPDYWFQLKLEEASHALP